MWQVPDQSSASRTILRPLAQNRLSILDRAVSRAERLVRSGRMKLQPCSVGLAEAVPRVGHRERTILLRGQFDPVCLAVMDRRGRRTGAGRRSSGRSNGHRRLLIINRIGDEHSRHRVLLSAQE